MQAVYKLSKLVCVAIPCYLYGDAYYHHLPDSHPVSQRVEKIKKQMNHKQFVWVVPSHRYQSRHIPYILSVIYFPQELLHQNSDLTIYGGKGITIYRGKYQAFQFDKITSIDHHSSDKQATVIVQDVIDRIAREEINDFALAHELAHGNRNALLILPSLFSKTISHKLELSCDIEASRHYLKEAREYIGYKLAMYDRILQLGECTDQQHLNHLRQLYGKGFTHPSWMERMNAIDKQE